MIRWVMVLLAISLLALTVSCVESGLSEREKETQEGGGEVAHGAAGNSVEEETVLGGKATGRAVESGARSTGKAIKQIGGGSRSAADGRWSY